MVTFQDNELSPEVVVSFLARGATFSRMSLVEDTTPVLPRGLRKKLVKDVFKGQS